MSGRRKVIRILLYCAAVLLIGGGIVCFAYPAVSKTVAEVKMTRAVETFYTVKKQISNETPVSSNDNSTETVERQTDNTNTAELDALYSEMLRYNQRIFSEKQDGLADAWSYEQSGIDFGKYGISSAVGVLRVPAMGDLQMPLYLGASAQNMANGAAQLGETSMPIGGKNTNCVIAGHRGWCGARYFLDIEQLRTGDMVYIDNLWETLCYQVSEIQVIEPSDINAVKIREGEDMVTLFTCHPYWASTYRYAVFCKRVQFAETDSADTAALSVDKRETESTVPSEQSTIMVTETQTTSTSVTRIKAENYTYVALSAVLFGLVIFLVLRGRRKRE